MRYTIDNVPRNTNVYDAEKMRVIHECVWADDVTMEYCLNVYGAAGPVIDNGHIRTRTVQAKNIIARLAQPNPLIIINPIPDEEVDEENTAEVAGCA